MNVFKDIRDEIQSPVLIAGWPGMGSVGAGAINYLSRKLNAKHFADIDMSEYFTPDAVVVEHGLAKLPNIPSNAFYYTKEFNLIIFESETYPRFSRRPECEIYLYRCSIRHAYQPKRTG